MKIKKEYQIMKVMNNDVLIDTSNVNSNIIKLNETSKQIVELLIKGMTKQEIIECILKEYNVDSDVINNDFDTLIDTLKKANVIDD